MVRIINLTLAVDSQAIAGGQQTAAQEAAVIRRGRDRTHPVRLFAKILIDALRAQFIVPLDCRFQIIRWNSQLLRQFLNRIRFEDQALLDIAFDHRHNSVVLCNIDGDLSTAVLIVGQDCVGDIGVHNRRIHTVGL